MKRRGIIYFHRKTDTRCQFFFQERIVNHRKIEYNDLNKILILYWYQPMTLYEQIREDMKDAMRNKDSVTLDTVRMLISSVKNKAIDLGKEIDDADVVATIKSDLKKLKDGLDSFVSAAREDLAEKARVEIAILEKYLPAQMSEEELEAKVKAKLADLGITDMASVGKAMGALMADLKEYADGSRIKQMIDKLLKKE